MTFARPFEVPVSTVGSLASEYLNDPKLRQIVALFESTFNIMVNDIMPCLGTQSMSCGPLIVVTTAPQKTNWPVCGVQRHARARISRLEIRLGYRLVFPISQSSIRQPDLLIANIDPKRVRSGLDAF